MEIKTGHKKDCTWATPLPNEYTEAGLPCYYGCNCGYDTWYLENEEELDKIVFIINRWEHGNGGVCGHNTLDKLPLIDAFKKTPFNYGVSRLDHPFGFFPVINYEENIKNFIYYWDADEEESWVSSE